MNATEILDAISIVLFYIIVGLGIFMVYRHKDHSTTSTKDHRKKHSKHDTD